MRNIHFRRIIAVLLAMLLMAQGVSAALAADTPEVQFYHYIFDEQDADGNYVQPYYTDARGNRVPGPKEVILRAAEDLPTSYDARPLGIITPPKYQSGTGACWAFATISCVETSMIRQGYTTLADTDYSEAYMAWFGQRQRTPDTADPTYGDGRNLANPYTGGGNWQNSCSTLLRGSGVQLEANAPFIETRDTTVMMQMAQPESDRYLSYGRLWQTRMTNDVNVAKQLLMEYGSLYSNYYDDTGITDAGYNKANYCYYQKAKTTTNHAITIVGWDDSFPATNFNEGLRPPHNGAWLVKGSWSTRYGNGGYYWLSYDDPSNKEYVAIEAAPADIYDNIYQYDGAAINSISSTGSSSATMANFFRAKDRELLTHVAAFNPNFGTTVKAQVYTGSANYTLSGTNPTDNMTLRASKTLYDVGYGYVTIPLTQPLLLEDDQAFTVVITMTDPNGTQVGMPLEGSNPSNYTESTVLHGGNVGESFMKLGNNWYDTNNYNGSDFNNVPVKAMTRTLQTPTLTLQTAPDQTTYMVGETLDTAGLSLTYSDEYGAVSTVTEGFTCSPTVLDTIGTQTVTVTYSGLSVTFDVAVQPYDKALTIAALPDKTTYQVGETLDTAGLSLTYTDEYGAVSTVTEGYTCSPTVLNTIGTQTVTVTYNDLSVTFDVAVQPYDKTLTIAAQPYKTLYQVGETLDTAGLSLTYTDEYGAASTVTEGYTCSPTVLDTIGTQTVTVSYGGATAAFDVSVTAAPPQAGALTVRGGAAYPGQTVQVTVSADVNPGIVTMMLDVGYDSQALELTGVQNGTLFTADQFTPGNDLSANPFTVLWMDALSENDHTATGALVTLTFRVLDMAAAGNTPITVTTGDGSVFNAALDDVAFTVENGSVQIKAFETPALTIASLPAKTVYQVDETLDTAGLSLTYSDEYGAVSALTDGFVCTPTVLDAIGTQTVTVTYNGLSVSFDVTVQPYERALVILTEPDTTVYTVGDTLDPTGLTLSYSDEYGVVSTVTDGFVCTPSVLDTEGTQTITVAYSGLTVGFTVQVQPAAAETPVLMPQAGSTTVIDEDNGFIYGLDFNLTQASLADYITVEGGSYRVISGAFVGTGSQVQVLDADGNVVSTYSVVIFGDVDGDGIATSDDIAAIKRHMTGAEELPAGSPYRFAADLDGDGSLDMMDSQTIKGILTGAVTVDQATRSTDD